MKADVPNVPLFRDSNVKLEGGTIPLPGISVMADLQ